MPWRRGAGERGVPLDGEDFHLKGGRAFEVSNFASHGAFNAGETDRIHHVFEVFEGA